MRGPGCALDLSRHALEIFQRIGAADVARKLAALTEAGLPA